MKNKIQINAIVSLPSSSNKLESKYSSLKFRDTEFNTNKINLDDNPEIEVQNSYDGSVNLIINDENNKLRLINSGFAKTNNNSYINTNNNIITEDNIEQETSLFKSSITFPSIIFNSLESSGNLPGGNYIFYIKYGDNDGNETNIISESGLISVYGGDTSWTMYGTILYKETNKSINVTINNLDKNFDRIYLYYTCYTSDINSVTLHRTFKILTPFKIENKSELKVVITGREEIEEISSDDLNSEHKVYNNAKSITQVQNMLFLGNVQEYINYDPEIKQNTLESLYIYWTNDNEIPANKTDYSNTEEYYKNDNIYNYLGYWPDEFYRLGIVYIYKDGSHSVVYNMTGYTSDALSNSIETNTKPWTNENSNTYGVFKTPNLEVIKYGNSNDCIKPIGIKLYLEPQFLKWLNTEKNIIGYFLVRQTRIPTNLAQAVSIPISPYSGIPLIYTQEGVNTNYMLPALVNNNEGTSDLQYALVNLKGKENETNLYHGLLCLDSMLVYNLQNLFKLNEYSLIKSGDIETSTTLNSNSITENNKTLDLYSQNNIVIKQTGVTNSIRSHIESSVTYINPETPLNQINNIKFRARAGNPETAISGEALVPMCNEYNGITNLQERFNLSYSSLVRGNFTGYLGVESNLEDIKYTLYTISNKKDNMQYDISIRSQDNSPFHRISNTIIIDSNFSSPKFLIYKGDCFTNTVTVKYYYNFYDPEYTTNDTYVKTSWPGSGNEGGFAKYGRDKLGNVEVNRGSVNALKCCVWFTYKCLSNYNLSFRSEDFSHSEEMSKAFGSPRTFYPKSGRDSSATNRLPESLLLNTGYSSTLSQKKYFVLREDQKVNLVYSNRVAFSDIQIYNNVKNNYRVFQGLAYQDINADYGAIVKLHSLGNNIFCVFEHGIGIIPINERALLSTQQGQPIKIYNEEVIPHSITIVSDTYGSVHKNSVIKTPNGIYGVDSSTFKIWRYNSEGFVLLSDMRIQKLLSSILKQNINNKNNLEDYNIYSYYNSFKNDVVFVIESRMLVTAICFNEILNQFISRLSWESSVSESLHNVLYSFNNNGKYLIKNYLSQEKNTQIYLVDKHNNKTYLWTYDNSWNKQFILSSSNPEDEILVKSIESIVTNNGLVTDTSSIVEINTNNSFTLLPSDSTIWLAITISYELNTILYENTFYIIKDRSVLQGTELENYNNIFNYSLWKHDIDSLPTNWYGVQHPFEFEFIVSNPVGLHKIFDNLVIISNNTEPESIEYEIIGDVYDFKESKILKPNINLEDITIIDNKKYTTELRHDSAMDESYLLVHQDCINVNKYGRRLGNIQYIEDKWNVTTQPIYFKKNNKWSSTRIRDKYIRVRIKYTGTKIATISSILNILRLSYV